ncbi:replication protein [Candidatus Pacearchaeota archaeon]|nr:replication protein [Candidatus Pacearchaeota archaeon]
MPQLENGYLKLANELVEAYTRSRIPGEAMQCLWFIIRKTYGFGKIEDRISISQFSQATGLKKQHAHRGISKLLELNLVTKNGDGLITKYRINKDSSTWKLSPKKVTYPKKVTSVPNKGDSSYPKKGNTKETLKDTITKEKRQGYFERIWKLYPNKDGKKAASKHFNNSVKTERDWQGIQKALSNYLLSENVKKGYIKNGSTWFNNWQDWIDWQEPKKKSKHAGLNEIDYHKGVDEHGNF